MLHGGFWDSIHTDFYFFYFFGDLKSSLKVKIMLFFSVVLLFFSVSVMVLFTIYPF